MLCVVNSSVHMRADAGTIVVATLAVSLALGACADAPGPVAPGGVLDDDPVAARVTSGPLQDFHDPPPEHRPWVRWHWPGNDIDRGELDDEVDALADAYFGGAEIQALTAGVDPSAPAARRLGHDTPAYWANVAAAMEHAAARELRIDVTLGSGWPLASARHGAQHSLRGLMFREWRIQGPKEVALEPLEPQRTGAYAFADVARSTWPLLEFHPEGAELVAVVAARVTGGARAEDVLDLTDTLELDARSLTVLTDQVDGGRVVWSAPEGTWQVIALFAGADGSAAVDVAEPGPVWVADHFDTDLMRRELTHTLGDDSDAKPHQGESYRGVFVDSLEFKTDRHWGGGILDEFQTRRGYDPRPWLPALLVPADDGIIGESLRLLRRPEFRLSDDDARIRYDWELTVSDLFRERFLVEGARLAAARGMELRAQTFGIDIDVLRAAGAVQVPEAEAIWAGGSEMLLRTLSSAAHLYGRRVTSAECLSGLGWAWTPVVGRIAADKLLGSGINQLVYHSFPYDHDGDYGVVGWSPFGSRFPRRGSQGSVGGTAFGERDVFWPETERFNHYVARAQYLLRQGEPIDDVLVYYPWLGFPNSIGWQPDHAEPFIHGELDDWNGVAISGRRGDPPAWSLVSSIWDTEVEDRVLWLEQVWPALEALAAVGRSWDWVNDERLASATARNGEIEVGDRRYSAVVVFEAPWMHTEAAEVLADGAMGGLEVALVGDAPSRQPGFFEQEAGDARVTAAFAAIAAARGTVRSVDALGPPAPEDALGRSDDGAQLYGRRLASGARVALVRNPRGGEASAEVFGAPEDSHVLDAWTGEAYAFASPDGASGSAAHQGAASESFTVPLAPYESFFVVLGAAAPDGAHAGFPWQRRPGAQVDELRLDEWSLDVEPYDVMRQGPAAGRVEPVRTNLSTLRDWREVEGLEQMAGRGMYTTTFELDARPGARTEIDLGWVQGTAEVRVNRVVVGSPIAAPFRVDATHAVRAGSNDIEVVVKTSLINWLLRLGDDPVYDQFRGRKDIAVAAGLLGPVRVRHGLASAAPP